MAYTDFADKVILEAWGLVKITLGAACVVGDLLNRDGTLADANANRPADYVAMRAGASGDEIPACKHALCEKKSTIGAGGVVTAGAHSGAADDVLWLSATAGRPSATPVASVSQIVGLCVDTQKFILNPKEDYFPLGELVATNKTLDAQDIGKDMIVTADAVVVTLPAVATGHVYRVINGGNDGDQLISVSPNASDSIDGPDVTGSDDKDWENTKATARAGDMIQLEYFSADGWIVTKQVGTWAQEA
ncbi:hypothetical protein CMI37_15205 [Candidatus Pacearchaeota archaeon]|nr:hypothetical protein [Candidatus Pacearchaeota archaeon]